MANLLSEETSPYLLQHAHNPVNWRPWNQESLAVAIKEDKPIIVSIGYSACHWCHVMEKESFEDENIAAIMNQYYVCIKVDREERPDVDQIYMEAVQAMGLQGGWPLNVILTPQAKPFYGGTYFPPQNWAKLLLNIADAFYDHREDIENSAEGFVNSINRSEIDKYQLQPSNNFRLEVLNASIDKVLNEVDADFGGQNRAPKFPMPCVYSFLLKYYFVSKKADVLDHVLLTLDKMALGGIYDQIGGGFARYSTDKEWFLPHFEKMLYDNGQLISLYTEAFQLTQKDLYKDTIYQTIDFLERELLAPEGGFYSALDADSEGEEGKFYVWSAEELKTILHDHYPLFAAYYNITDGGNWEHYNNILYRDKSLQVIAEDFGINLIDAEQIISSSQTALLNKRNERIRPGLDDKILAGWNGLTVKGLADAYRVFNEQKFLRFAVDCANFIVNSLIVDNILHRNYKNGKASIIGYLEDYAAVIEGFISLYQANFDEKWLTEAIKLSDYCILSFYDLEEGLFYYTDANSETLIARKKEIFDNVIPASNSIMANNLFHLGKITNNQSYLDLAERMVSYMVKPLHTEIYYLANWASLFTYKLHPTVEFAIVGEQAQAYRHQLDQKYYPNKIITGTATKSELALLQNRTKMGENTAIYVCYNNTCQLPTVGVEEAWNQVNF